MEFIKNSCFSKTTMLYSRKYLLIDQSINIYRLASGHRLLNVILSCPDN